MMGMGIGIDRRHAVRYHEIKIRIVASSSPLFILHPLPLELITKLLVLGLKSLKFLTHIETATTLPVTFGKSDRNEETCDEQSGGKGQGKRNDSFKESGVTHILHLLKTSGINYGKSGNSVSPRLSFYLNSFGGCVKSFSETKLREPQPYRQI